MFLLHREEHVTLNVRTVYDMRPCGVGLHDITKFCGLLNMPLPITQYSYDITKKLGVAAENVAKLHFIEGRSILLCFIITFQKWCSTKSIKYRVQAICILYPILSSM